MNNFENQPYYDGRFADNMLVVIQTGCGNTTFVQNFVKNKIFLDLESVDWVSKITFNKIRKDHIRTWFNDTKVKFYYAHVAL